ISRTEIQAVQYAMLSLLAAMFFSGFMLSIDLLAYPVRYLAYAIPVTYGISMIQDVMLRGMAPKTGDIVGLCALLAIYGVLAVLLLGRKLAKA
ncbi:MAG TPA: ABC transporter permease, partial [Ilumatobacteraceae bacterium]|nr:ABC transporter permease [Ilumatobacteraceae bacterium]